MSAQDFYFNHSAEELESIFTGAKNHLNNFEENHITPEERSTWNNLKSEAESIETLNNSVSALIQSVNTVNDLAEAIRNNAYGTPTEIIGKDSNLDNYTTAGAYICQSSAVGATLFNCPCEAGFRLEVKPIAKGVDRCVQILYPNINSNVLFYVRRLISTGWTSWGSVMDCAPLLERIEALEASQV